MAWSKWHCDEMKKSFRLPSAFLREDFTSRRSLSNSEREMDPEYFVKKVTPQIKEVYAELGTVEVTPEQWDEFSSREKGRGRRNSCSVLKRMGWSQFINYCKEVCKVGLD